MMTIMQNQDDKKKKRPKLEIKSLKTNMTQWLKKIQNKENEVDPYDEISTDLNRIFNNMEENKSDYNKAMMYFGRLSEEDLKLFFNRILTWNVLERMDLTILDKIKSETNRLIDRKKDTIENVFDDFSKNDSDNSNVLELINDEIKDGNGFFALLNSPKELKAYTLRLYEIHLRREEAFNH